MVAQRSPIAEVELIADPDHLRTVDLAIFDS
jgi:hypothetical protein